MKPFLLILIMMNLTLTSSMASCLFCCGNDSDDESSKQTSSLKTHTDTREDAVQNPIQGQKWKKKKVEQDASGELRTKSLGAPLDTLSRTKSHAIGHTDVVVQPEIESQPKKQDGNQNDDNN